MSSSASTTPFPWSEWENPFSAYRGKSIVVTPESRMDDVITNLRSRNSQP